jgi:hypothetical protein
MGFQMEYGQEINQTSKTEKTSIFHQLRVQLDQRFQSYPNESAAYHSFEKYSKLHRRTLKRFLESKCTSYPQTLVSFYKWLFKTECEKDVIKNLDWETKNYLVTNGYNINSEKRDITSLICKSTIHYEIYLMTEDQQVISKAEVEKLYGSRGVEALNDLLLNEVVHAIDEKMITTGPIRSNEDVNYFENAAMLIPQILPWDEVKKDNFDQTIGYTLGNFIASIDDKKMIDKAFSDYKKKLCEIHERGLKAEPTKREKYIYSNLVFKPQLERKVK